MDPREHPDYARRYVKPPSWETFGNRTQFTSLRGFGMDGNRIVGYVEEIDKYTKTHELGNVLWPSYPIIFADNLGDLADEVKRRGLYLFDLWGYVPGSGPGGYWQQYKPPADAFRMLEDKLGERWLGMDIGEQDGRYIGGYANQMFPIPGDRFENYLNFQRHFERMGNELGNRLSVLVSLNFGHYLLKDGVYATIGAETAQGLPNGQVYYSFIRGAGKQYGAPWFGNASVFNRWGYKTYGATGPDHGPTKGTSLNLLKRLMYSHVFYNCVFAGFESSWFDGEALSPIGRIQQAANRWVLENGQPGVMMTPAAVMLDFHSGWSFPRHLYTDLVYRVWGNVPYGPGDYLTDGVLDMLYPGYQDSSYYHDERGFIAPTPYGDIADCLLSDSPGWLLRRYPVLILGGELSGGEELRDKLSAYVENGGYLVITAGNLSKFADGLAGLKADAGIRSFGPDECAGLGEEFSFELSELSLPPHARVLERIGGAPSVVESKLGKGSVLALASPFGIPSARVVQDHVQSRTDQPLPKPYPLLRHVRAALDAVLRSQKLFDAGDGLNMITCRKGRGEYSLLISNDALAPKPFKLVSLCGEIESAVEIPLDQSEKNAVGFLPEGFENAEVGKSSETIIAGGDVRIFRVKVREESVEEIPHMPPSPGPRGRLLPLRGNRSIQEEILLRPTFFEHFDGVVVDWNYLRMRDVEQLKRESGWIARQGLRVCADLTSGLNLYPDLRLVGNDPVEYESSMAVIDGIIAKMPMIGARDLILSLHRTPENNISNEDTWDSFAGTLKTICDKAASVDVTVHLRQAIKRPSNPGELADMLARVDAPNLRIAPSLALLFDQGTVPGELPDAMKSRIGMWFVSAPEHDENGRLWAVNAPAAKRIPPETLKSWFALAPDAAIALDASYRNKDEEYADIRMIEQSSR